MNASRIVLEVVKCAYAMLVASMVCLFFCLLLDLLGFVAGGGWNVLLGAWPIFSGTVAAVVYGSWGTVLCLLIGLGVIARIILWDSMPSLLQLWWQPDEEESV